MRRAVACLILVASTANAASTGEATLRGYTPEHSATEVQWEQKFRALPDAAKIREDMQRLSARPHHVGAPYDKDNAEWLLAQLKSQITRTAAAIEREAALLKSATQTLTAK